LSTVDEGEEAGVQQSESFTAYVAARGRALWRAAWLLTGDVQLAEDLVQVALAKAWPHYDRVVATGSFEAYVRRAMLNTYLSWRGRKWQGEVPGALPERAQAPTDPSTSVDIARALAGLTARQRAVVVLRYFEDLTEAQTADLLGCSVASVKTHHRRALAALRTSCLLADHESTRGPR
jgi:RNA polymerase sigma-70 factor (sigma-E family)